MNYETVIGLEVHVELATKSKIFCSCSAASYGAEPNSHVCPACCGMPGMLPVVNKRVVDFGMKAKNAIQIYNERLEAHETGHRIWSSDGVSVICADDRNLTLSYMFRNVWVKCLPSYRLVSGLKPYKDHLQTAALLCNDPSRREELAELLALAGVVRITSAGSMSRMLSGEAHDGTYPLRQYSRVVETDIS